MNNHNITMESFQYLLKEKLEEQLGSDCKVVAQEVVKNNGVSLQGLMISHKESNVSPTIYINHLFDRYQEEEVTLEETASEILSIYQHHKIDQKMDMSTFTCFEKAKSHIYFKLINTEANQALLEDVPHQEFFDLSIIYVYEVNGEKIGNASIIIHNNHLKLWKIEQNTLHETAFCNTPKLHPYHIESLHKVMQEICLEQLGECKKDGQSEYNQEETDMLKLVMDMQDDCGMYVLSNQNRMFGAACLLYENILKDFATATKKNLLILPSSIHEVLLLPVEDTTDVEHFKECVMDVNRTQLEEEDILSDSVYYYERNNDELTKIM